MTKYRIHVVNEDGHVADRKDVSRANDQKARLAAKHEIKADGQAEVWDGGAAELRWAGADDPARHFPNRPEKNAPARRVIVFGGSVLTTAFLQHARSFIIAC
jgi:hypothetical protein